MHPELLAPAGDWDCARAAVENGADAIYFGLEQFNARMRAHNFTTADLPVLLEYLHERGVKGIVTVNTLVFANELESVDRLMRSIIEAGVDAAIVQDVGLCRRIRRISPDFPIHASTQMTITDATGVRLACELGCSRVVLAREVPVSEIARIRVGLLNAGSVPAAEIPSLEVFVHGALCVAYSGQCLTSESLGGRSANRGVCAQACRMPYDLLADGEWVDLGDRRYLLSPQDLAGIEMLPALIRAGVSSFKIEGRLKSPEYVANITGVYRRAIDAVLESLEREGDAPAEAEETARRHRQEAAYDLEMAFSRGLFTGWLRGVNNQTLVHARFGKKRGVHLGTVLQVRRDAVRIRLEGPLKPGDGVVFDAGRPDLDEEGGRVYEVRALSAGESELRFGRDDINFSRIHPGDHLWKTSDPELERRWRQSYAGAHPRFQRPIEARVAGRLGSPLTLRFTDGEGRSVEVISRRRLEAAQRTPLTTPRLIEQVGRLGGAPFRLGRLENRVEGDVILPVSELNRLRREAVEQLRALRRQPRRWTLTEPGTPVPPAAESPRDPRPAELVPLVRSMGQLEAALEFTPTTLYCEFEDPRRYREAVKVVRNRGTGTVFVAPPRIFKTGEEWILRQVESAGADGVLVRNAAHLLHFRDTRRIGDFPLNVANPWSAEYFIHTHGLEHLTASYDLNHAELLALLQAAHPDWFEITLHQHMPMFHMEHCVFCAFLSTGTDYTNCGRPCDRREVRLRDRVGAEHPLRADAGCRNTVFNALAQTGAEYFHTFVAAGAWRFRIEFLNETPEETRRILAMYRRLANGDIDGTQLWRELKLINRLGVTRGPLGSCPG